MLLDYLAHDWLVQTAFLLVIGGGYCFTLARGHMARENDAERLEKRLKDLIPLDQRIANHKKREKEAGHQLARDYE